MDSSIDAPVCHWLIQISSMCVCECKLMNKGTHTGLFVSDVGCPVKCRGGVFMLLADTLTLAGAFGY